MPHLDPDTTVVIEKQSDGRFTFTVKFRGVTGPTSRPMESREDIEMLGAMLVKHLQHHGDAWLALAQASSASTASV